MSATAFLFGIVIATNLAFAEDASRSEQEVRAAVDHFLRAFEDLDMPSFIQCFADDASVFFPIPEPARRFNGKSAVQAHFREVFAAIRQKSASGKPPFHRLMPENLQVQLLGGSSAVVTFQMSNAARFARRTLVLQKRGGIWLIVHLHASNTPNQALQPTPPGVIFHRLEHSTFLVIATLARGGVAELGSR